MKWPWVIASTVGLTLSPIPVFLMTNYLPGQVFPYASPSTTDDALTPEKLIDGRRVAFVLDVFAPVPARPATVSLPVRLRIPAISVDAAMEHVGVTSQGDMDVPERLEDVAWFELGPRPGERGSAVFAGHYGRKDGKGSVFDNLHMLRTGDIVYVVDESGASRSFVVRESRSYDAEADAVEVFGSNDDESHLNLITCEGVWDTTIGGFPKRLVVFTDLVGQ